MPKKRDYWNRKALFDTGADYLIVFGQNCSGKSYQGKEECISRFLKGEKFFYLRRWQTDINQNIATSYFADIPINKLTDGEWDGIIGRSNMYYLVRTDEEGKQERSDCIGYYGDLNEWQRYKSNVYVNCTFILFEEFITDGVYLDDEPLKLQRLVTTVFRDHKGQVMMIGNTVSRVVPYFQWTPNVPNQKQGTIELYHMHDAVGEGNDVLIAVEYGGRIKGSGSMFFGEASKSIMAGEWSVDDRPKLPKDHIDYELLYDLVIEYQNFGFVVELLFDDEDGTRLVYVYPRKPNGHKIERKITDKFSTDIFTSRYFKDNVPESYIQECIATNRVCYSDNLTASDFLGVIAQMDL